MKVRYILLSSILLILTVFGVSCRQVAEEELPDHLDVYYFYDNICGSCDEEGPFIDLFNEQVGTAKDTYPSNMHLVNIFNDGGMDYFERICSDYGLDPAEYDFPLLLLGGKAYVGTETIEKSLKEAYLVAAEDLFVNQKPYNPGSALADEALFADIEISEDKVPMIYFYRLVCPACIEIAPMLDELPEAIERNGQSKAIDFIRYNTRSGDNGKRIISLFEAYDVPDEDRKVPIIFLADSYLVGSEAIQAELMDKLNDNFDQTMLLPGSK